MPFEIYVPRTRFPQIDTGFVSVNKSGQLTFPMADAARINLKAKAVVLIDKATSRIGVRAPKEHEATIAVKFPKKRITVGFINITGAIQQMGLDLKAEGVAGSKRSKVEGDMIVFEMPRPKAKASH